jgi:prepilin-type processing-associated H-X9-DG protein
MAEEPIERPEVLSYARPTKRGTPGWLVFLIVTAVVLLIVALMLPAFSTNLGESPRAKCSSNMHQIGLALIMYSNGDPQGRFAPDLPSLITTQELASDVFICPSTYDTRVPTTQPDEAAKHLMDGGHESYIYVGACLTGNSPRDAVALYEPLSNHANDGSNVLFADGHVEYLQRPDVEQIVKMDAAGKRPIFWPPHPATQP